MACVALVILFYMFVIVLGCVLFKFLFVLTSDCEDREQSKPEVSETSFSKQSKLSDARGQAITSKPSVGWRGSDSKLRWVYTHMRIIYTCMYIYICWSLSTLIYTTLTHTSWVCFQYILLAYAYILLTVV